MNTAIPSPESHALIVEGTDDLHVATHIWRRHANDGLDKFMSISTKGGVKKLIPSIEGEIKAPGRRALGIIVDADDNSSARWESIAYRLRMEGVQVPSAPDPDGTIIEGNPRVGIWLMPDNVSSGELEDFIVTMIPSDDLVWPLATNYIDGIPIAHRKFADRKETRAKVHAWLAAMKDPRPMGRAIRDNDLEIGGALCQRFVRWLDNLMR